MRRRRAVCRVLLLTDLCVLDRRLPLQPSTGYEADLQAAKTLPDLDVIVGGHSHTFLYTPTAAGPIVTRKPGVNGAQRQEEKEACRCSAGLDAGYDLT